MSKSVEPLLKRFRADLLRNKSAMAMLMDRGISWAAINHYSLGYDVRPTSKMRDRLVFPVRNEYGGVVAWQGRALKEHIKPKYWHTLGDWKSQTLYGLHEAIPLIVGKGYCVITEGNMDVLSGYDLHMPIVGTMGTALTEYHCILLRRFVKRIYILTDNDAGGDVARGRFLETLSKFNFSGHPVRPPKKYKDINGFVMSSGVNYVREWWYSIEHG